MNLNSITNSPRRKQRLVAFAVLAFLFALSQLGAAEVNPASIPPKTISRAKAPSVDATVPPEFAVQGELIQQLLNRIDQLEKKETERVHAMEAAEKAHEELERKLLGRLEQFESKVGSLEAGRVLPEITVPSDDSPSTRDLDQKIRVIERKNELAAEASEARAKELPRFTAGQNGFAFSSSNTNFTLKIKGVLQVDSRTYFSDNELLKGNDSFLLRRARPVIEGTVFRDFDFQFVPDFGGSSVQIFDANLNYRLRPEVQLRIGKFKGPVGLEQLQPDAALSFNERSLATSLVPTRSIGAEIWGDIAEGALSYAAGVFNTAGDGRNPNTSDFDDDKEFAGRIFGRPFAGLNIGSLQGFGLGLGASYSQTSSNALGLPGTTGGTLPGYASDGQQQFFAYNPVVGPVVADGPHWRLAPQASYYHGPFGLLGEYTISHQSIFNGTTLRKAQIEHNAWQVSGQWVLTGEPASFGGINPKHPFSLNGGGWGAWQLVGRYGQLNIDEGVFEGFSNPETSAKAATSWSVGINWWLNRNIRLLTSFSHTTFDGGGAYNPADASTLISPATVTHQDENVLFTRVQLAF